MKPLILVTNDDGIYSKGLLSLYRAMNTIGQAVIVAPDREKSAVSHSLTLHRPLRTEKLAKNIYALNGTPTDCVTIAVSKVLKRKPDLVVSGINKGGNLGDDITYSGTVSAAIEGTILSIPSLAISMEGEKDYRFATAAGYAKKLAGIILREGLPGDTLLNINVPNSTPGKIKGVIFTRQGKRIYDNSIQDTFDPKGSKHYWIGGGVPLWKEGNDTDFYAVKKGYVSITPIHLDLTNYGALDYLKSNWNNYIG
ncbi:5'-nucleotidase SurE [bacterium BMS3Abin07]|nr:5'-nucleotidase SurE [bacterium BMS3Abin07]GBE33304.1 5'-nucleotidase SurE [bacterium BMS3Bbin05]